MRARIGLLGVGLLLLSGCESTSVAAPPPEPVPVLTQLPAASAGGACELLDYSVIEKATGTRFDVAAASEHKKTRSCVLQTEETSHPDLTFSVITTEVKLAVFTSEMIPSGAQTVKGLGKSAYRLVVAPTKKQGAGAEVGWITEKGRVICLRYTFASGQEKAAAEKLAPKLVSLAKKIDVKNL